MQATELVIRENMHFSRKDVNTPSKNLFTISLEISVLACGQSIIDN